MKKILLYKFLQLFGLLVVITSCKSTINITIQVLRPAQVAIPANIHNVVLVNHSNYLRSSFIDENSNKVILSYDSLISNEYMAALYNVLSSSPRFTIKNTESVTLIKDSFSKRYSSIDWGQATQIANKYKADALIVLENYSIPGKPKIATGYVPEYGSYYGYMKIENSSLWKIYDITNQKIVDECVVNDTAVWEQYGNSDREVKYNLPDAKDAFLESCYKTGTNYAYRISPGWEKVDRFIYTYTNKEFIKAADFAKNNQWMDAIEIWKKYPYCDKKELAIIASFNMAVACETLDDIDAALEWAAKSYLLSKNDYTQKYIEILEKRNELKKIVEKQLQP